ncbi:hypothetical protein CYY_007493 [Polysphondylium violaceum]|uniref:C2 domain-containing protein n=1 Tax=Polysphondylium violaceum TaxID=133409 RepID=A0A8J4UQU9_9MYCE|nr:hypothetical protein CYY_007493 [Polysphondylium violaceum]
MPCIVKVRIVEARDLPIMDRSSALADAYVEIKCGQNDSQKTDIQRKTLNPIWNQDFRFDFPNEADIQDKPLDIRVWDYDLVSKNDMIGSVLIDLNCLLDGETPTTQIHGWFPIYDTLRGIRGEILLTVKLEKFQNANPFKESSDGVQFFSVSTPFSNYRINNIHSFVEELIVENDPEYHWTDTFRASRLSNFERQMLLYTLTGKLRRQMGKKVLEMGGNAVLGYKQHFDFEGDSGIVARGYGTAVTLRKVTENDLIPSSPKNFFSSSSYGSSTSSSSSSSSSSDYDTDTESSSSSSSSSSSLSSSDSEISTSSKKTKESSKSNRPSIKDTNLISDVQILTLDSFQSKVLVHIGGVVAVKSVKILKKSNTQETRDIYWTELRNEIKSHAKSLGCNYIIGYIETTTIQQSEDLCIFSATGTAAVLDLVDRSKKDLVLNHNNLEESSEETTTGSFKKNSNLSSLIMLKDNNLNNNNNNNNQINNDNNQINTQMNENQKKKPTTGSLSTSIEEIDHQFNRLSMHRQKKLPRARHGCSLCHVPFTTQKSLLKQCAMCKKKYVPEVLLATIEPPPGIPITGVGGLIQARVCRLKKKAQGGEANATQLSESIPFVEYDLYNQLMFKLKLMGMNAAFSLKTQITFSDTLVICVATATAVFLTALPAPPLLHISRSLEATDEKTRKLLELQTKIEKKSAQNHTAIQNAPCYYQHDPLNRYFNLAQLQQQFKRGRSYTSPMPFSGSTAGGTTSGDSDKDALLLDSSFEQSRSDNNNSGSGGGNVFRRKSSTKSLKNKSITNSATKKYNSKSKSNKKKQIDSSEDEEVVKRSTRKSKKSSKKKKKKIPLPTLAQDVLDLTSGATSFQHQYLNPIETSSEDENDLTDTEPNSSDDNHHHHQYLSDSDFYDTDPDSDTVITTSKKPNQNNNNNKEFIKKRKALVKSSIHHKMKSSNSTGVPSVNPSPSGTPIQNSTLLEQQQALRRATSISSSSESDAVLSNYPLESNQHSYVLEIDDKYDEDKMRTALDLEFPQGFSVVNTETQPGKWKSVTNVQLVTAIRRVEWDIVDSNYLNTQLSSIFTNLYESVMFKLRELSPCCICGLKVDIKIPEDDQLQILLTAMCTIELDDNSNNNINLTPPSNSTLLPIDNLLNNLVDQQDDNSNQNNNINNNSNPLIPPPPMSLSSHKLSIPSTISVPNNIKDSKDNSGKDDKTNTTPLINSSNSIGGSGATNKINMSPFSSSNVIPIGMEQQQQQQIQQDLQFDMSPPKSPIRKTNEPIFHHGNSRINELLGSRTLEQRYVELTPLSFLPGNRLEKYLGRVNIHLIKESFSVREEGGLGVFSHVFLREANAIARAHVMSMGGNVLIGYDINEFSLILDSGPKGQAYSLLSITGDVFYSTSN